MPNRYDRDDERNRGEYSGGPFGRGHGFDGPYARDPHRGFGDDYARDGGWSGGGRANDYARDDAFRDRGDRALPYGEFEPPGRTSFRGRGPKNWRRSDESIREMVNELLTDHDDVDATDIDVSVQDGEVTLTGMVGNRREKRMAEDVAWSCRGVRDVHNRLTIGDRETHIGKASE